MTAEPPPFLDSNILIYAVADDPRRTDPALALVEAGGLISAQVRNEVIHVLRRKQRLDWDRIAEVIDLFDALLQVVPVTPAASAAALPLARLTGYSIWDAQIVATAAEAGCTRLYSEDMQHGRRLDALEIVNPFAG
jgi:predicted nucleic acid-binding protein